MSKLKERIACQLEEIQDADFEIITEDKTTIKSEDVVPAFAVTLEEAKERVKMLQAFVRDMMIPGQDYGLIPGCQKPSLYKSGAEKLCDIYGFSKIVMVTNRVEDWEKPFLHYEVKVRLINKRTEQVESEGIGNANSREKKFLKQDTYTLSNTILKMAKKRAFIDAVLSATRTSNYFTQDLEDLDDTIPNRNKALPIVNGQLQKIYTLADEKQLSAEKAKQILLERYQVDDSRLLTAKQGDDFIKYLSCLKN